MDHHREPQRRLHRRQQPGEQLRLRARTERNWLRTGSSSMAVAFARPPSQCSPVGTPGDFTVTDLSKTSTGRELLA
jgi:hypothetical protein